MSPAEPAFGAAPALGPAPAFGPACTSDHCITCGDVAVEVLVTRLLPDGLADVDTGQGTERVSVALVTAAVGDQILVHAGEAIAVVGQRDQGPSRPEEATR